MRNGKALDDCNVPKYVIIGPLLLHGMLEAPEWPSAQVFSKMIDMIDAYHVFDEI